MKELGRRKMPRRRVKSVCRTGVVAVKAMASRRNPLGIAPLEMLAFLTRKAVLTSLHARTCAR